MAAYQTQQVNVGSIAAPDVGSVFANFVDRINRQQSNQLDNMRQAAQFDRQQVLNQRADQDWNRQQGVYKAKADVAADFATNQFADKYTGTNKVNNDAVVNAYVKYVENGGEMTDDLNKRVQALTEQNRGFQEDATPAIAQELVKRSNGAISMADAMSEAKGIAMGLPSRIAQQELADKETKRQQDYQDMLAKNNLEKFKMQADIAKDNQEGRYKDAEVKFKQFQAMYGGGTGSSGGGAHGPVSYMDTTAFLDSIGLSPYGTGWVPGSDTSDAYAAMNANNADNVPARVTLQALKNSVLTDERGSTFDMAKFKAETDRLKGTYVDPKTVSTFKEIQAPTDEQWQSTVPKYVDRTIIGATPNTAEARARLVVPELFRGDPTKIVEETKVSKEGVVGNNNNKVFTLNNGEQMVRNTSIPLTEQLNNPGAVKLADSKDPNKKWVGEIGRDDQGHIIFDTPENGARAQIINMQHQIVGTNGKSTGATLDSMIRKYAVGDQDAYITRVSKETGIKPSKVLDNEDVLSLVKAMSKHEAGGKTTDKFNDDVYNKANELLMRESGTTTSTNGSSSSNDIINKFLELNKVSPSIHNTDTYFRISNFLSTGEPRYSVRDKSNFLNAVNKNRRDIKQLLTPENMDTVHTEVAQLENDIKETDSKLAGVIDTRNKLMGNLRTTGTVDSKGLADVNKQYITLMHDKKVQQNKLDTTNSVYTKMVEAVHNDSAGVAAESAKQNFNESLRKAYDPTVKEALFEIGKAGFEYVGLPKTKAMYAFLNAPAKVVEVTKPLVNKLPVVQGSARTISETAIKRGQYVPTNSDVLSEIGAIFKNPNLKSDPAAKEQLASIAAKYPEFADEIWQYYSKIK